MTSDASNSGEIQRRVYLVYAALVILNIFDVGFTYLTVHSPNDEANPIMASVFEHHGIAGIAVFKMVILCFIALFLKRMPTLAYARKFLYGATGVYALLACWHLYGYFIILP